MDQELSAHCGSRASWREYWLSRNHSIQRVPTVELKHERDELSKSEGTNPFGYFNFGKIFFLNILKIISKSNKVKI